MGYTPRKLKKPCAFTGCPEVMEPGQRFCKRHQRLVHKQYDAERGTATQRGYNATWRRLRKMVLAEQPLCQECLRQGRMTPATEVHHLDGNVKNNRRENLQPLCKECHSRETAKQGRWG